ncbi:MAG: hypothetical protein HKN77_01920 [Woeseiaceae bacterium]|nr:hypothetical protein [Woeseiaceae bacterium]
MIVEAGRKSTSDDIDDDDDFDSDEIDDDSSDDTLDIDINDDDDDDDDDNDNVGDLSVELNIEELVAKLEDTDSDDVARQRQIKRRLEELRDERDSMKDLDSTYNFNFDDEL